MTVPSILHNRPILPATRARASRTAPGTAAAGNFSGPSAAIRNCSGLPGRSVAACVRRSRGQAAGLREQLHENHGGHDRLAGEVALKIEVVGIRYTARGGTRAVLNVNDLLDQPHGRLMRQAVNQRHRA